MAPEAASGLVALISGWGGDDNEAETPPGLTQRARGRKTA